MRLVNEVIFSAANANATQTSAACSLNQVYGWSAQFVFTGAPVGTLKAQVSSDPGANTTGDNHTVTNWSDLADSSLAINGPGTPGYNYNGAFYNWIRFVYTFTSGTGAVSGRLNTKGV